MFQLYLIVDKFTTFSPKPVSQSYIDNYTL